MRLLTVVSILLCLIAAGWYILSGSSSQQVIEGQIFGTYYKVKINAPRVEPALAGKIAARLEEVDRIMSVFREDSELSAINRAPADTEISLSPDMQAVMRAADEIYRRSHGAFDPTLGRLIDMWGFGSGRKSNPSTAEINAALASAGFDKLRFSDNFSKLRKTTTAEINLSAIAKGFGVDAVAAILDNAGYTDYIVEIGGELKARGTRDGSLPWNIGINRPAAGATDNILVLSLSNMAAATSGNYRNFYRRDGLIFGHTISSQTGRPAQTDVLSASVFDASCMYADAYATAIVAMGLEAGKNFAEENNLPVIIFDNNFQPHFSTAAVKAFKE